MAIYCEDEFGCIAAATGVASDVVQRHEKRFEAAAIWYRIDRGAYEEGSRPAKPRLPSDRRKKLQAMVRSTRSLLKNVRAKPLRSERIDASWRRLLRALP
jgi:hypothetical protein